MLLSTAPVAAPPPTPDSFGSPPLPCVLGVVCASSFVHAVMQRSPASAATSKWGLAAREEVVPVTEDNRDIKKEQHSSDPRRDHAPSARLGKGDATRYAAIAMVSHARERSIATSPPSTKLLGAALAGLLAMTVTACSNETGSDKITSSKHVEDLDAEGFKMLCDARHGTVEALAHCGGLATGPGFAYDTNTQELSEHSCKGGNTCGGWNCLTGS